jgi:hypothetical protein
MLAISLRIGNVVPQRRSKRILQGALRGSCHSQPGVINGGAHLILGHVTRDELLRFLTSTDAANGFANRFLWICSRRSKSLPEGGDIQSVDFAPLTRGLADVVSAARNAGELRRDDDARNIWREVYGSSLGE